MVHPREKNVATPKGLEGKTLADSPASTVRVLFPLYAKKAGIDVSKVTWRDAAPPRCRRCSRPDRSTGSVSSASGCLGLEGGRRRWFRWFKYAKVLPGLLGIGIVASDERSA